MPIILDGTAGITTPEIVSTGGPLVVNASAPDNSVVVNASGNVGIGTSSPLAVRTRNLEVTSSGTNDGAAVLINKRGTGIATLRMASVGAADGFDINYNFPNVGMLGFYDLTAATTRVAIDSSGNLLVGTTSYPFGGVVPRFSSVGGNTSQSAISAIVPNGTTAALYISQSVSAASTGWYHFIGQSGNGSSITANNIFIFGNGNIQNINNSYGAMSDIKLKENIVDATPKLSKLCQVRVVNYNLKGEYEQHKQLGVIAQELEQIFPGMVDETADRDSEGNDLGTTTKAVKYSVFVPMLIKGLQELKAINDAQAQTIESLTARVVALENQIV